MDLNNITKETLSAIPYGELKTYFQKIGISDAFKGGERKKDMIEKALVAISALKDKVDNSIKEKETELTEEQKRALALQKSIDEENKEKELTQKKDEAKIEVEKPRYTKEVLLYNIANIDANLDKIPQHREILLRKKKILLDMLIKDYNY